MPACISALLAATVFAMACSPAGEEPDHTSTRPQSATIENPDDLFLAILDDVPGFGGYWVSGNILNIFLVDTGIDEDAAAIAVLQHFSEAYPQMGPLQVNFVPAAYDVAQLRVWYDNVWPTVLRLPGVTYADLQEGLNKLEFGL